MDASQLPAINASFNAISACLLALGYVLIKQKRTKGHKACMLAALLSSSLFLAGYLSYHFYFHAGRTQFRDPSWVRPIYLAILLTHTVLAVVILPMIALAVGYAAKGNFEKHRRMAVWTWPLWMYVSLSGVAIYFLLYQVFPQR